ALRPQPSGHHQRAQLEAAAVPADGGLRPLRPYRHRRAMGVDSARQGAGGGARGAARLTKTIAVIPAGGAGTRLWARSRRSRPKHTLPFGGGGRSLLRDTYDRIRGLSDDVYVVTELRQREIIE